MDTIAPVNIRERLRDLNTKAYYLLVALSFVYRTKPTLSLKLAISLTAAVAVLPVQDFVKSARLLEAIRRGKVAFLIAAFACTFWWVWFAAAVPSAAAQKPAPPQATEQQKPKESAGDLDSRLKAAEEKADRALMEKDYIERAQKDAKDYYEKAFSTQVKFLDWLIVLAAAVPLLFGLFGFRIVDRIIQHAVDKATTNLETKFDQKLAGELKALRDSNTAQMKQLQEVLEKRIDGLEAGLKIRSDWQFQFLQGMAGAADKRYDDATGSFRRAIKLYKKGKPNGLLEKRAGAICISNFFKAIAHSTKIESDRNDRARAELKSNLFDGLEDELEDSPLRVNWLGPLIEERKKAPSAARQGTLTAAPAAAQESPKPAADSGQAANPQEHEGE